MTTIPQSNVTLKPAQPVAEYDWATNTYTYGSPEAAWKAAVVAAAAALNQPPYQPRLQAAMDLVLAGAVDDAPFARREFE